MVFRRFTSTVLALAAGAFLLNSQATAQGDNIFAVATTQDLLNICTLPEEDPLRGSAINYCLGYLDGAIDYHDVLAAHEDMKPLVCYPETATLELGIVVFIDWAEDQEASTDYLETPPIVGITRALASKWPCA